MNWKSLGRSAHMEFSVSFEPGEDMAVLAQYLGMEGSSKF